MSVSTDRRIHVNSSRAIKAPCKVATTANITLSGLQTIDGVSLSSGDRVLVKDQTDLTENGIFVADTSTWNRSPDFDGSVDITQGTRVPVAQGTVNSGSMWRITTSGTLIPGTSSISFLGSATSATLGLGDTSDDSLGDALIGVKLSGGTARTLHAKLGEIVSITDFGGAGDAGVTENGAALQAAHDALPADGGTILIPPTATYYGFTTSVAFTKPVRLAGEDIFSSELLTSTDSLAIITTTSKIVVENIGFTATGAAAGTAVAIKTLAAATNHTESLLFNCYFIGFARCYWSERTAALHIMHCRFAPGGSGQYGLYLENTTNPDEGDSFVHDNYFAGGTGETSIFVASTSGINIANNKFNGPVAVHLDVAVTSNNTGNFLISNNSFEGHVTSAIRLIATTGTIEKIVVHGNQFSSASATHIIVGQNARNACITGNIFNDTNAANGIGIDIQANARNTTIVGNAFHQIYTAIKSGSSVTGQEIRGNKFASGASVDVTDIYLGGEDAIDGISGLGSAKELEADRYITTTSNAAYTNAFQFRGDCVAEIEVVGIVQGDGNGHKYQKVLVDETTITDLIALVSTGSTFDLQVTASGGYVVVGIKRNGATGTSLTMNVRVKLTGYARDFSIV